MTKNNIGWFSDAGDAGELIHLSRFVSDGVFATDEGGYGTVLKLDGIDPQCLSEEKRAACNASVLQAQQLLGERVSLFQTFIKRAADKPAPSSFISSAPSEAVRETLQARHEFVSSRPLFEVTLHWTLYVHPPKRKTGSFEEESARMLRELESCASNVSAVLAEFGVSRLGRADVSQFFAYIAGLEKKQQWPNCGSALRRDLANDSIAWHNPGLVFNQGTTRTRFAQPFSLAKIGGVPTAGMLAQLLSVPAEFVVVMEARRRSASEVRSAIGAHEWFVNFFKHNPLVLLMHRNKELPKSAKSTAADAAIEMGGLGGIEFDISRRGLAYCTFSVLGMVHASSENKLREDMGALHRVFGTCGVGLHEEGYGALSAYQALFPGAVASWPVKSLNVRRRWLREDYVAQFSLWFAPETGKPYSDTLEAESRCLFETRAGTAYHFDQFGSGPQGVIVTGEPRRGKTFFVNFTVDHEMKYGGYVFIFDSGGSYENVVLKHGGAVVKVGLQGPRLNPFALPNSEANRNQTTQLVMLLLGRGGAKLAPQDETSIRESVAAIYELEDPKLRRLRYLILSPELQPYLARWIDGGVYANVFDNAEDDLRLARIVSFDFEGVSGPDQKFLMEPLLFWIRLRINELIRCEGNLALPKLEVYDEVWRLIEDEGVLAAIFETMKTAGKKLGGIILATQDTQDLGVHAEVIRNACPDAVFLGGAFKREQYQKLFAMNDTQLDLIPSLRRGEMLLLRRHHASVVRLAVDEQSKWLYSTHPQDVRRRTEAIQQHGREKAFELLTMAGNSK